MADDRDFPYEWSNPPKKDYYFDGKIYIQVYIEATNGLYDKQGWVDALEQYPSYPVSGQHSFKDGQDVTGLYELQYESRSLLDVNVWNKTTKELYAGTWAKHRRIVAIPSSPIQEAEADVLEKEAVERIHELKTWPVYWFKVFMGRKTFEVRKNDRDFKVGDILILKEYDLESDTYTGRNLSRRVTFILEGGGFGIEEGFCVMSIQ